jgi:type I restriction enzyme M protein
MNMILHDNPLAIVMQGNTLTDPKFKDGDRLKQFDFVVANPPFSDKRWSTGLDPFNDPHDRSNPSAFRPPSRAITLTSCISSVR